MKIARVSACLALALIGASVGCVAEPAGDLGKTASKVEGEEGRLEAGEGGLKISGTRASLTAAYETKLGVLTLTSEVRETTTGKAPFDTTVRSIYTTVSREKVVLSELTVADGDAAQIDVTRSLKDSLAANAAHLKEAGLSPEELKLLDDSLLLASDVAFRLTPAFGRAQIRNALGYHAAIVHSIVTSLGDEKAEGALKLCEPAPEDGPLHCADVIKRMESIDRGKDVTDQDIVESIASGGEAASKAKPNHAIATIEGACTAGTQGSDWGCCGNYSGACYYCSTICYLHDWACESCGHWYCGWQCQPG